MDDRTLLLIGLCVAFAGIYLVPLRAFWVCVLALATLISFIIVVVSLVHLQILIAIGFLILTGICAYSGAIISEDI